MRVLFKGVEEGRKIFKANVKTLLKQHNIKLAALSKQLGVANSTLDSIINGDVDELKMGVDKALAIAEFFGVSVESLYGKSSMDVPIIITPSVVELLELWENASETGREAALVLLRGFQKDDKVIESPKG